MFLPLPSYTSASPKSFLEGIGSVRDHRYATGVLARDPDRTGIGKGRPLMILDEFQLNVAFVAVVVLLVGMFAYAAWYQVATWVYSRTDQLEDPYWRGGRAY